jgi:DNA-binding GntR family transcriptional regulator
MAAGKSQCKGPVGGRRRAIVLPPVTLDRASSTPLYAQIRTQIADAARRGGGTDAHLPSTRLLARMLGVSRNTILTAYEELAADGVVEGRAGSGMVVTLRPIGPMSGFSPERIVREAQYPSRTVAFDDPDGSSLYLAY